MLLKSDSLRRSEKNFQSQASLHDKGTRLNMSRQSSTSSLGPGQYEVFNSKEITEKDKRYSKIGKGRRFVGLFQKSLSPGPKYQTQNVVKDSSHRNLPAISFPKETRFSKRKDRLQSLSPSPSQYTLPTPVSRNVKPIKLDLSRTEVQEALKAIKTKSPGP